MTTTNNEKRERDFTISCACTLVNEVIVTTSAYGEGFDDEGFAVHNAGTADLRDAFRARHLEAEELIVQLAEAAALFRKHLEHLLINAADAAAIRKQIDHLKYLIWEAEGWITDDVNYSQE